MPTQVRALNAKGVDAFRRYLQSLRDGDADELPTHLLDSPAYTQELSASAAIEKRTFKQRLSLTKYLVDQLAPLPGEEVDNNRGLWAWLSLFYLDHVCPPGLRGTRRPGRDYRHIPDPSYRYRHRHLLSGPYTIYRLHGDQAAFMLCGRIHVESSLYHEIAGRQSLIANPGVVEAASLLYYDPKKRKPKRGAQSPDYEPGTLRRFVEVLQQLDVTYDIHGMPGPEILKLLPPEFEEWRSKRSFLSRLLGRAARAAKPTEDPGEMPLDVDQDEDDEQIAAEPEGGLGETLGR